MLPALSSSARLFLEGCLWPRCLTPDQKQAVFATLTEHIYRPGALVCRRGELAANWIGVVEGFVRVQDSTENGRPIMYTGVAAGGWLGEGSLLKVEPLRYEIVATRETRTLHMPLETFIGLVDNSGPFTRFLLDHLNERLGLFISMVKFERLLEPTARVARSMASLFHPVLYPNTAPKLRISQQEIAWMVGVSRQRVNAALQQLTHDGIVLTEYGCVTVLNLSRLEHYGAV